MKIDLQPCNTTHPCTRTCLNVRRSPSRCLPRVWRSQRPFGNRNGPALSECLPLRPSTALPRHLLQGFPVEFLSCLPTRWATTTRVQRHKENKTYNRYWFIHPPSKMIFPHSFFKRVLSHVQRKSVSIDWKKDIVFNLSIHKKGLNKVFKITLPLRILNFRDDLPVGLFAPLKITSTI